MTSDTPIPQAEVASSGASENTADATAQLLATLTDPDTGVAFAARQSLQNLSSTTAGPPFPLPWVAFHEDPG
jgi:hypothetical protein